LRSAPPRLTYASGLQSALRRPLRRTSSPCQRAQGGDTVALGQVVAATGLGGLGKTQLAVEFVYRFGRFFAGGVFWLSFASPDEIPLQIAACAGPGAMGLAAGVEGLSVDERLELVMGAWQGGLPRLLVFDNCEEEALLAAWRPPGGGCRVLVTSRRSSWSPTLGVNGLPLDVLPRPDSVDLLRRYRPDLAADDPGLDAIAHELGDLPLALHLAGSYLRTYSAEVNLPEYLAELGQPALLKHASLLGRGVQDSPSPTNHVQSLAQTFALSLGRLDRDRGVDKVALALLARLACLAPGEPVPRHLLNMTLEEPQPLMRADALRRLAALGLVELGEGRLRLHRLLAHFVRQEALDNEARPAVDRALIDCGQAAAEGRLIGTQLTTVIPHLTYVAAGASAQEGERAGHLSNAAGRAMQYAGILSGARPWYERAVASWERGLGPDNTYTADGLNNLAGLLQAQGELQGARSLYERAVAIYEQVRGPNHPSTALGLNNLALLLRDQGEMDIARSLFERALAIRERMLGSEHPSTATSLNNLGLVLWAQGELDAARPLFERALAIREREQGPDHPNTANSLSNLAGLLRDQGELDAARPLLERALAIHEQVQGPDHPNTGASLNRLGLLLRKTGELDAARPLLERALAITERVLGPDHLATGNSLNDLGLLLRDLGDLETARPLLEHALAITERVHGPDHLDTATSLNNLGLLLRDQGDPDAARPLLERALAIYQRVRGPHHPDTTTVRTSLTSVSR